MSRPDITTADDADRERYEIRADGRLAGFLRYRAAPGQIELIHTEVLDDFEGRGLGGRLIAFALDDARARGLAVIPTCPFVADYIRRHPGYADLVRRPTG